MNAPAPRGIFQDPTGKFAWIELTNKCNLECIHCYAESSPFEPLHQKVTTDDWKAIITELTSLGFAGVQFIGGEPMLHPDLKDLVIFARKAGMRAIEIYTNGTRIDREWVRFFQEHDVQIALSFYSHLPKVHATITKNNSSFERTVSAIKALVQSDIRCRVGIIKMTENADHIGDTKGFLEELGIKSIRVDRNREIGRGNLSESEDETHLYKQLCGACGTNKIAIDSKGDIYPCVFCHKFQLGNVKNDSWVVDVEAPLTTFLEGMKSELERRGFPQPVEGLCNPKCSPGPQCSPDRECSPWTDPCAISC